MATNEKNYKMAVFGRHLGFLSFSDFIQVCIIILENVEKTALSD